MLVFGIQCWNSYGRMSWACERVTLFLSQKSPSEESQVGHELFHMAVSVRCGGVGNGYAACDMGALSETRPQCADECWCGASAESICWICVRPTHCATSSASFQRHRYVCVVTLKEVTCRRWRHCKQVGSGLREGGRTAQCIL